MQKSVVKSSLIVAVAAAIVGIFAMTASAHGPKGPKGPKVEYKNPHPTPHPSHYTNPVKGGTTTITLSAKAQAFLTANGITISAVAPATVAGNVITFTNVGGKLRNDNGYGTITLGGGLQLANASHTLRLGKFEIVRNGHTTLTAKPAGHHAVPLARSHGTDVTHSSSTGLQITGELRLLGNGAKYLNALVGKKHAVHAGFDLGSYTITVQ